MADDFDGASFLQALLALVEAGSLYIRNINMENTTSSEQPLYMTVQTIRYLLQLVGFTNKTVMAGISNHDHGLGTNVLGGESAVIEEMAIFRSQMRTYAIEHMRSAKDPGATKPDIKEMSKLILKECDDLRKRLSSMGVELLDGSTEKWKFKPPSPK